VVSVVGQVAALFAHEFVVDAAEGHVRLQVVRALRVLALLVRGLTLFAGFAFFVVPTSCDRLALVQPFHYKVHVLVRHKNLAALVYLVLRQFPNYQTRSLALTYITVSSLIKVLADTLTIRSLISIAISSHEELITSICHHCSSEHSLVSFFPGEGLVTHG